MYGSIFFRPEGKRAFRLDAPGWGLRQGLCDHWHGDGGESTDLTDALRRVTAFFMGSMFFGGRGIVRYFCTDVPFSHPLLLFSKV